MTNTINITVSGQSGVGKSALVYKIKEYLRTMDFDVEFKGGLDFSDEIEFDMYAQRYNIEKLQSIRRDTKLVIHEKQELRKSIR